jgi:hypothetical protein
MHVPFPLRGIGSVNLLSELRDEFAQMSLENVALQWND